MSQLREHNASVERLVQAWIQQHVREHAARQLPVLDQYPLVHFKRLIATTVSKALGRGVAPTFDLIDRAKFGGDVAVKFPALLAQGGPKAFIGTYLAPIVEALKGPALAEVIVSVVTKGMYINLTLSDAWLLAAARLTGGFGASYGRSKALADKVLVIDYSSPNVAKALHAGHIRSTIIGHVLGNVAEAAGALVYRVNHVNDFGGFGFILEGWRRFRERFPAGMAPHLRLIELYRIRRALERVVESGQPLSELGAADRSVLRQYLPEATNLADAVREFAAYTIAADERFAALERGESQEVALWRSMVEWSLQDFQGFYDSLAIHIDLVLGESFYFEAGDALVDACLETGTAVVYGPEHAQRDLAALATAELTDDEKTKAAELIRKDVGATVVPFASGRRFVVRRKDGRSIYATRDLGAIKRRVELFAPTDVVYVVGQEQQDHFAKLFAAARATQVAGSRLERLVHVYFGFYVDKATGKKLSSRESTAGVVELLNASFDHFQTRLLAQGLSPEEARVAAKQLSVGSIVFNDLSSDIKGTVEIDPRSVKATVEGFESSGGAYVVYAACRARAILRKFAASDGAVSATGGPLDPQEVALVLKVEEIPEKIAAAATMLNPTLLLRHLHELASQYNGYYAKFRVIDNGVANPNRLAITKAVAEALTRTLAICHVECPERM